MWGQLGLRELVGNYWFGQILVSGTSDRGFKSHPPHQHLGSVAQYLHLQKQAYRPETMISHSKMPASLRSVALLKPRQRTNVNRESESHHRRANLTMGHFLTRLDVKHEL